MPALHCQECGKSLLPVNPNVDSDSNCICSDCGRNVFARTTIKAKVACPKCNLKNETTITV